MQLFLPCKCIPVINSAFFFFVLRSELFSIRVLIFNIQGGKTCKESKARGGRKLFTGFGTSPVHATSCISL